MSFLAIFNGLMLLVYTTWMIFTGYLAHEAEKVCLQELSFGDIRSALTWWLSLSFIVLLDLLCILEYRTRGHASQSETPGHRRRPIAADLFAGFLLALPAVIITSLGFVTAFPHFLEALNPEGSRVQLMPKTQKVERSGKGFVYLVAIDVSASALPNLRAEELNSIKDFTHRLFENDSEGTGYIVKFNDPYAIYAFAGKQEIVASNPGANASFQDFMTRDRLLEQFDHQIESYLKPDPATQNAIDPSKTDLLGILDNLVNKAAAIHGNYDNVTAIVFSDFLHDPRNKSSQTSVENGLRSLMESTRRLGNVQIVGVSMENPRKSEPQEARTRRANQDIKPFLKMYGEGIWREMSLHDYANAADYQRSSMLIFGVYRERKADQPLYLKYLLHPQWQAIPSTIEFPKEEADDFDRVALDLSTPHEGDGALSKVKVAFGPGTKPFVLGVGVGEPSFKNLVRLKSTQEPLELRLDSVLDVSRSVECDLRIAIPARSEVRSMRLVIIPVLGKAAMEIFRFSLCFLAGAGIILAFRIAFEHFLNRPAKRPALSPTEESRS